MGVELPEERWPAPGTTTNPDYDWREDLRNFPSRPAWELPYQSAAAKRAKLVQEIIQKCWDNGIVSVDVRVLSIALDVLKPIWDNVTGRRVEDIALPRLGGDQLGLVAPEPQLGAQDASAEKATEAPGD